MYNQISRSVVHKIPVELPTLFQQIFMVQCYDEIVDLRVRVRVAIIWKIIWLLLPNISKIPTLDSRNFPKTLDSIAEIRRKLSPIRY